MYDVMGQILGVVKDFNFKPLREEIEPMILRANTWGNTVIIKAEAGRIAAMKDIWGCRQLGPGCACGTGSTYDQPDHGELRIDQGGQSQSC